MSTVSTATRPTGIPVRRPNVDLAQADIERWFVPGDPLFSHLLAALSAVFPNGEDFFVESVRNYRSKVEDDPEMKARVKGFIGQEAMHGREHRAFNVRLAELGYPTVALDRDILRSARRLQRLPKPVQLAITSASEHFTSVLARAVLADEETRRTLFPAPDGELLITWHALEELEHKDVAFDLLQTVSRSYTLRMLGLLLAAVGFGRVVAHGYARGVLADRHYLSRAALRRNRYNFRHQQMVGPRSWLAIAGYVRPGFHPRHIDTDALVVEWRERLAPALTANRTSSGRG
jgi:predicted metal-dependent hydrolase